MQYAKHQQPRVIEKGKKSKKLLCKNTDEETRGKSINSLPIKEMESFRGQIQSIIYPTSAGKCCRHYCIRKVCQSF